MSKVIVSCCVTCMNRGEQLSKTLEKNLELIAEFDGAAEICLVNFIKDKEGENVDQWVRSIGPRPGFKYFVTRDLSAWHASIAKNTAHLQGEGIILLNLDCDNFLSRSAIDALVRLDESTLSRTVFSAFTGGLVEEFTKHKTLLGRARGLVKYGLSLLAKQKSGFNIKVKPVLIRSRRGGIDNDFNGTYGQIGLGRDVFRFVSGYDESFPPMGGQDKDILWRAYNCGGVHFLHIPQEREELPILNSKEESLKNTKQAGESWEAMQEIGTLKSLNAVRDRRIVANLGKKNIGVPVERVF